MAKDIFELEGIKPQPIEIEKAQDDGIFQSYVKPLLNYETGLGLGAAQGLANALGSIGNLAPQAYEAITGQETGRIPKVDLMQYAPEGEAAKIGGMVGEPIGGFAAPGGVIAKGVSKLPLITRLPAALRAATGGGAAGAALSEDDRATGALVGAGLTGIPMTAAAVAKKLSAALKAPDLKNVLRETQSKVNETHKASKEVFNKIENELYTEKKASIPNTAIADDVVEQASTYMDKTDASKKIINAAKTGDYKALRKLQAALRTKAEKAKMSKDPAKFDLGNEMLEVRDKINSGIQKHLKEIGKEDLAQSLDDVRKQYKQIQDVYLSSPYLAKVFGKEQAIPQNPLTLLEKETAPMKKFYEKNPEVKQSLSEYKTKTERAKKLEKAKSSALNMLGYAGGIELTRELLQKLLGKNY